MAGVSRRGEILKKWAVDLKQSKYYWQKRWVLAILANMGYMILFGIRCNIGAAKVSGAHNHQNGTILVEDMDLLILEYDYDDDDLMEEAMLEKNASMWWVNASQRMNVSGQSSSMNDHMIDDLPPLQSWNKHITGLVVSATFYGSLVFQLPGGLIANKISAKSIFGWAVCLNAALNLLMPVACMVHYTAAIAIQFGQGLMFGITYPALFKLWKHWAPPLEKTRLVTSAMCGSYIGVVLGMPLSATLTKYVGWEAPFYLYGVMGILWFVFWSLFTADTPRQDSTISERELQYIETSIGDKAMENPVKISEIPWKSIAKSKPFWAIVVASFCRNWTLYVYVIFSLSFLKENFHMDIEHAGYWTASSYVAMVVTVLLGGRLADYILTKHYFSVTTVRKLFNTVGFFGESIFLFACALVDDQVSAIACLICSAGMSGFSLSGFNVNTLDIAPRYAGILMGIANGLANLSGMVAPTLIEHFTKTHNRTGWQYSFLLCATIQVVGVVLYLFWSSGRVQTWAAAAENKVDRQVPTHREELKEKF